MSRESFNRTPYFDDFNSSKNMMKILFKPGRPVQARELNQIQSIFQNQIEKFANHIFKNGSKVSNARGSYNAKSYVRLQPLSPWLIDQAHPDGYDVDLSRFPAGMGMFGMSSGISARLVKSVNAENGDPPTIYVVYTGLAIDGITNAFIPGEVIKFIDDAGVPVYSVKVKCPGCAGGQDTDVILPTGQGHIFNIDAGIFYYEGMFIENLKQDIIVSKYGEKPTCKVGFDFVQTIITSDDDVSLLDNALGYPNSTAPGADRYKVSLELTRRSFDSSDGDNFILLAIFEQGTYRYLKADSDYSDIMDMIAKRTFETNGNYTVRPFKVRFIEDKATGLNDPNGYDINGDEDLVRAVVGPSVSYVLGYRFENTGEQFIPVEKARDTKKLASFIKRFEDRTYILLKPLRSYSAYPNDPAIPANTDSTVVNIYNGAFTQGNVPTGTLIGTFRVYDVMQVSGTINDSDPAQRAVFKYYITDLNMLGANKLSDGLSFVDANQVHGFKAIKADDNAAIYNPGKTELIWKLDRDNLKTLRTISDNGNPNPPGSISITLRKKMSGVLNSQGQVTFTSYTNEYFLPYDAESTVAVITDNDGGAGIIHTVDLGVNNRTAITPTSFAISLGATIDVGGSNLTVPGNTITVIHNVLRTNAQEDSKVDSFVTINAITPGYSNINLGITDAYEIEYVKQYNPNTPGNEIDITEHFALDKNVKDFAYRESFVTVKSSATLAQGMKWRARVKYFSHDVSNNLGYYTIDSYKQLIADNVLDYEDAPVYSAINKSQYPLFGCFDFRPSIVGSTVVGSSVPAINSTAIFDIEYYLGRIDLLSVNKKGEIYSKKGTSSDSPSPPKVDEDAMALYEVHLKPYTYSISDIDVKFIENKRYTMRDIGKLEERIKTIEYYTVLNLLEKSAQDMSIKDGQGLDRFKNGFVADNFQSYQAGDITSSDFRAALDRAKRELRPQFTARNKKLKVLAGSSDAIFRSKMAMIDYDSVLVDEQPYATKHISINPYFQYKKTGDMVLTPNLDTWCDTTTMPALVVDIDTGVEALKEVATAAGVLKTEFGDWVDLNKTVTTTTNTTKLPNQLTFGATVVTERDQTRTTTTKSIESRTDSHNLGDRVTDVSIHPYMRATTIQFFATKMKKNAKVWAFFDKKPVSAYTRMIGGTNGEQLMTDGLGQIAGFFDCPNGMFFTGDREFYLTNDEHFTKDPDVETTNASAIFFSGGLDVVKQSTSLNVISPVFKKESDTETRHKVDTVIIEPPTLPAGCVEGTPCWACAQCGHCGGCWDPIAQSFKLEGDRFLTGLDTYFEAVDLSSDEIWFQIRTMINGYPSALVLGEKRYNPSQLTASEDSKTPFHVEFDFPIFIKSGVEYCFIIGGFSPETRAWVARLGQEIVDQPGKIVETQPTIGSSFRSQNSSTWNAEQFEDIKYRLYAAKFKQREMTLEFEHVPERIKLSRDPLEAQATSRKIRVYAEDHGFNANDKVTLSFNEDTWITVDVTDGQLNPGLIITTPGGFSATISNVRTNQITTEIQMKNVVGTFINDAAWVCSQMDWNVHDNFLVEAMGYNSTLVQGGGVVRFNQVSGTFKSIYPATINGIPFEELSKQHIIQTVDSMDSFIIETVTVATETGRFGGEDAWVQMNEKYEIFNVSGAYIPYDASENWEYTGIGHNPINGVFVGQDYQPMEVKTFVPGSDMFLGQPHKLVCEDNKSSGGRMVKVNASFVAPNEWVSPMVNTDTFSIITVSNRVEWITTDQFNIEPNATNRYVPECDPMNGSENYKYVTKTISLKNPASDLVVAFDIYKDINADFDMWIKLVAPYEGVDIDSKRWMRVVGINKTHHSVDLIDRVDLEITMSAMQLDVYTTNTAFTTIDWTELPNEEYSSFKIKLVGKAKNPAKPPLFQSFRAIAVT